MESKFFFRKKKWAEGHTAENSVSHREILIKIGTILDMKKMNTLHNPDWTKNVKYAWDMHIDR